MCPVSTWVWGQHRRIFHANSISMISVDAIKRMLERLKELIDVPFNFEHTGSQIVFYDPGRDYLDEENGRQANVIQFEELENLQEN